MNSVAAGRRPLWHNEQYGGRVPLDSNSVRELLRVALTAIWRDVSARIEPSVIPVFKVRSSGQPEFEGSGVLLKRGSHYYLVSAAHVFDHCNRRPLVLDGGLGGAVLTNEPYVTNPPAGMPREKDRFDIGVVPLTNSEVDALGCARFQELPEVEPPVWNEEFNAFLLIGCPVSHQGHNVDSGEMEVTRVRSFLGPADSRAYHLTRLPPETHLLMKFRERDMQMNGQRGAAIHPRGMSGGGVWRIDYSPLRSPTVLPPLEGIFIERPPEFGPSLVATRTRVLTHFLDANGI